MINQTQSSLQLEKKFLANEDLWSYLATYEKFRHNDDENLENKIFLSKNENGN